MVITIAGGGNIGTQFAVHCAEKGHDVIIYTSKPELFNRQLYIEDEKGHITHKGQIRCATDDPSVAFEKSEVIFVTVPATLMDSYAKTIYQYTSSDTIIGVVPGNGGGECAFKKCIERGNILFGIERVPAVARLVKKGDTVKSIGYRNELHVSALPKNAAVTCAKIVENIFDIKTTVISDYLNLTLTPSNPVLHTTRLKILFGNYHNGISYNRVPLFYEEWDDATSELLFKCDEEVQSICKSLTDYDLKYVKSLKDHYESYDVDSMTRKISSINAFKGIETPMIKYENSYIPDLQSRYFTADFSYGLNIMKQIACFAGVETPIMDDILEWYESIAIEKKKFKYENYGIINRKSFDEFYHK